MGIRSLIKINVFILVLVSFGFSYEPPSTAVSKINSYRGYSELTSAASGMDIDQYTYNMTTWQIANGGFYKAMANSYKNPYSGGEKSGWRSATGEDLATIDNNATIQEMRLLAVRYKETTNSNYKAIFKESFNKAVNFILTMQRSSGGIPQVWPKRGNYSDHVTLNDNAMIRVMVTMMDIANATSPFDSDIIDETTRIKMTKALDKAIEYLLKAQIVNNGNLTVWCAQHDTLNYAPRSARAYELESKSGSESAGVVWFLMNWPEQTETIQKAIKGAIAWYKKTRVTGLYFNKKNGAFESRDGNVLWYRFYEVDTDDYFFCDRDGVSTKTQDFTKISEERRTGYQWAGDYGTALLNTESAYLKAIENDSGSEYPAVPLEMLCGNESCNSILEGENYLEIDGVKESSNSGFVGEAYANVTNAEGSFVSYGVTATSAKKYTVYIRFSNGGTSDRAFNILANNVVVLENANMEMTGAWTNWDTKAFEIELPLGYSEIKFISLSKDGMANIDALGWTDSNLFIGNVNIENDKENTSAISHRDLRKNPSGHYVLKFEQNGKHSTGIYLMQKNSNVKFRVNGIRTLSK
ncbi:MAG: pectate lyase [Fibrobacteraceae bacterium]|nr:pectate lyase [Fibrobacteraceae bacterium]